MSTYTVIRTDLMSGTHQPADLFSLRYYNGSDEPVEVENGVIAQLSGYEEGEREVMKATAASSSTPLVDCVVIAGVEVMYDENKKNLEEFINEADTITRGYALRSRNMFSVTAEGFVGGVVPAKGDSIGVGALGKLDAAGTGFGTCVDVEIVGRYTYYVIQIGAVEK